MENGLAGTPLSIETRALPDGALHLVLAGELDLATVAQLDHELDKAQAWGKRVVLDLRNLGFIDSSGLHAVLRVDRRLHEAGGKLTIVRGPRAVEHLFNLTGLDTRLHMVDPDDISN